MFSRMFFDHVVGSRAKMSDHTAETQQQGRPAYKPFLFGSSHPLSIKRVLQKWEVLSNNSPFNI